MSFKAVSEQMCHQAFKQTAFIVLVEQPQTELYLSLRSLSAELKRTIRG